MLILTRRIGETLMIGSDEVTVTVLGIQGSQVRLGVRAPAECIVDREEIFLCKQQTQMANQQPKKKESTQPATRNIAFKSKTH